MVGERPLVRALGHTVAALEAVGAEHRVLNPQVRRAVGRVRGQAFFRLIFLLHTPVPLPQARRPDSCQTVWSSTTGWRLSCVRVAQMQAFTAAGLPSRRAYSPSEEELVFCFLSATTTHKKQRATEQRSSMGVSWVREIGRRLTLILEL